MTLHRFFLPAQNFSGSSVTLTREVRDQITRVLRLNMDDQVELLDNSGAAFFAVLENDQSGVLNARIISQNPVAAEPRLRLTLCFGLTRREKLEWILQKGTEIGVSIFQPFISSRTLVQKPDQTGGRRERWTSILREAAEQSGRGRVPELHAPLKITDTLSETKANSDLVLACWVGESLTGLGDLLVDLRPRPRSLAIFTGPEGGFTPDEIDQMREMGVRLVSLGRRVLRMETAAILAPALALSAMGEMGAVSE